MPAQIFVNNDNDVTLSNYRLSASGAPVSDALPAFTVYSFGGEQADGTPIVGQPIAGLTNVAMNYVPATGIYRGLISGTAPLTAGGQYYVAVTFANYDDTFADWFSVSARNASSG